MTWSAVGCWATVAVVSVLNFNTVECNNVYHSLASGSFQQNWGATSGLLTTTDNWDNVPSIIGYLGDDSLTSATGVDPQTLLSAALSLTPDVIVDSTAPDSLMNGGVAEFEITNPVVALQGSNTADAPNLVLHVDATGRQDVNIAFNARDIDGSADNAVSPIAVHFRLAETGDYTNVPGCFVADVSTGGAATQVTPVTCTLPAAANNAAQVQIRIITANAAGVDEWIGIDDIVVSSNSVSSPTFSISGTTSVTEGAAGTATTLTYTITLSAAVDATVTVATADGTATAADNDYSVLTRVISFSGGVTQVQVSVDVNGDATVESDETFRVSLSSASGATIDSSAGSVTTTITNDDGLTAGACCALTSNQRPTCTAIVTEATCDTTSSNAFFPTSATACSADLCCPQASSDFECPTNSNSIKVIVLDPISGPNNQFTVCINGWDESDIDPDIALPTFVSRTLTVTSDGFTTIGASPQSYSCTLRGQRNAITGFPSEIECTGGSNDVTYTECTSLCVSDANSCVSRKRAVDNAASVASFASFQLQASAFADPHFRGANGIAFDFHGKAGGIYTLFTAPQFFVTMHLAAHGPSARFMTKVGVMFRDVQIELGATKHEPTFVDELNRKLRPHGAYATKTGYQLELHLCAGHSITVTPHHTTDAHPLNFVNVQVTTPGCNDTYGGALGQTYQCRYLPTREKFVFDRSTEESFRVPTLFSLPQGFEPDSRCNSVVQQYMANANAMQGSAIMASQALE